MRTKGFKIYVLKLICQKEESSKPTVEKKSPHSKLNRKQHKQQQNTSTPHDAKGAENDITKKDDVIKQDDVSLESLKAKVQSASEKVESLRKQKQVWSTFFSFLTIPGFPKGDSKSISFN